MQESLCSENEKKRSHTLKTMQPFGCFRGQAVLTPRGPSARVPTGWKVCDRREKLDRNLEVDEASVASVRFKLRRCKALTLSVWFAVRQMLWVSEWLDRISSQWLCTLRTVDSFKGIHPPHSVAGAKCKRKKSPLQTVPKKQFHGPFSCLTKTLCGRPARGPQCTIKWTWQPLRQAIRRS